MKIDTVRMGVPPPAVPRVNKIRSLVLVTTGASIFFSGVCIYKGDPKFYQKVVMPVARLLPPETAHNLAVLACKYKMVAVPPKPDEEVLTTKFFDKVLSNPIGIAAGFDKQGEAVEGLEQLGFGLVEIGSVTPEPQSGNPTPRVFRLPNDEAIINRYGFNSEGHRAVYDRLLALRKKDQLKCALGVNLGKNKTSMSPLSDYVQGVQVFGPLADYLVVNVSSPNTPGLRDLQNKRELELLLEGVIAARNRLVDNKQVPILLKLSPDLSKQEIKDIAAVINKKSCRVDGLIISNTTVKRENLKETRLSMEIGGLSGAPLRNKSTLMIAELYHHTCGKIPIIGVGGISSGADAFEKLEAGASYLQIYTALIYHGPPVVTRIKAELAEILREKGYRNVQEAVGGNYKQYISD